jgi:hypothetical protein
MTMQLDPLSGGAEASVRIIAADTGTAVAFATAAGVAVTGTRDTVAGRARSVSVSTVNLSTTVTGVLRSNDVAKPITGTGIPAGTHIVSVGDTTFVISAAATATGTITATVDVDGLLTFRDLNPNAAQEGEPASDDVIDDPEGTVWELKVKPHTGPTPAPVYFYAPDLDGFYEIGGVLLTSRPSALAPPGATNAVLGGDLTGTVGNATINPDSLPSLVDVPAGTVPVPTGVTLIGVEDGAVKQWDLDDAVDPAAVDAVSNVATARILGRVTSGTGDSEELTAAQAWTILDGSGPAAAMTWTSTLTINAVGDALTLGSGTAGHGKVLAGASALGAAVAGYSNTADAEPAILMGSALGLRLGAGGASTVDWSLTRTGAAAATVTGALTVTAGFTVSGGTVAFPAGSIANAALTTNPLDLANATNPTSASAAFNTAVRASRIDQMTNPSANLNWPVQLEIWNGNAAQGKVQMNTTAFGAGVGLYSNSGHANPTTAIGSAFFGMGAGNASTVDWTLARTGAAAATITGAVTLAGNLTMSARSIITDTTTGLTIGTGATQKLGFYGATPVVRRTLAAAATDAATTQSLANSLRTALIDLGLGA